MASALGSTPNGIRLGAVYTPPEFRSQGYGTALVASLSQLLLDSGHRFCFLYTDLSNPISNKLYMRIGYLPAGNAIDVNFL
jgi:predicted GNAT family acetyltransferase